MDLTIVLERFKRRIREVTRRAKGVGQEPATSGALGSRAEPRRVASLRAVAAGRGTRSPSWSSSVDFAATAPAAGSALRFTWFATEIEAPPATPASALTGKRVVVVNGRPSSAERVVQALARASAHAHVFAPAPKADVAAVARALVREVGPVDGIIDLGLEEPFSLPAASDWETPIRRTLGLMHACYDDWLAEESASRLFYLAVTWIDGLMGYGEAELLGGQTAEQPLGGIWAGFAKTLPQELPNCNVRVLDLAPDEACNVGERVAAELYRWGLFEVGYCGGRRYTLQAQRSSLLATSPAAVGAGDVVLFSGGARGIGLRCARAIAKRYGTTVIITGREPPADGNEPWARLDDAGFKRYAEEQLRRATPQNPVVVIRRELARLRRRRDLHATLDEMAKQGLPVHYRVCDVTDAAAVRALCDEFGDALRVVIHNAGVDRPVRLAQKSAEDFIDTVRTKVLGFANLCAAVEGRPNLLRFCNVGSLTGRWGGMTGETDYAAANEALARLGLWAHRHALCCSVKTIAWPTWDGVGMITNLEVTKRYVSPMAIDEGVQHWLAELADDCSGEVMFMGAVGRAVTPIQIRAFGPVCGLPNIGELVSRHHHVGEPQYFRPFARLVTHYRIDRGSAPFLHAYCLNGKPALPSAILMEHACGVGGWITPDAFRSMELVALSNVRVNLDSAILSSNADSSVDLQTEAVGYWLGAEWMVSVRCMLMSTRREVLRLTLVHRETPAWPAPEVIAQVRLSDHAEPALLASPCRATWNDHLLRGADWKFLRPGAVPLRIGRVRTVDASDLWALPHPPMLRLPVNQIENVLRAVWAANPGSAEPPFQDAAIRTWSIESIALSQPTAASAEFVVERSAGHFSITDGHGLVLMDLMGVSMLVQDDSNAGTAAPPPVPAGVAGMTPARI